MTARVAALYRHPVKGFTPEPLQAADLTAGAEFPCDRLYAVEDGPSGFDPAAPTFIRKQAFTVLMRTAEVARARTAYDEATHSLTARAEGLPDFSGRLDTDEGRAGFAGWLGELLGEAAPGPLKVLSAPDYRFMDHPLGHVSILNLASVRDLSQRAGHDLDPLRFRANILVEGLEPWAEMDWGAGRNLTLGGAAATVFKPIVRCAATEVDPTTAERDFETVKAIFDQQGHTFCGLYLHVTAGGRVAVGDSVEVLP